MNNSKYNINNCLIINLDNREDLWNDLENLDVNGTFMVKYAIKCLVLILKHKLM